MEPQENAAAPTPTTETASTAPQAPEAEKQTEQPPLHKAFAKIAKREAVALEKERKAKEVGAQIAELRKQIEQKESEEAEFKANPLKLIEKHGFTLDTLIEAALAAKNGAPPEHVQKLEKRLEEVTKTLEQQKLEAEEARIKEQVAYVEQQIEAYKQTLSDLVTENPDKYELILVHQAQDAVWNVVEKYFEDTQQVPDPVEVADMVEEYLEKEAEKLLEAKKLKARMAPPPTEEPKSDRFKIDVQAIAKPSKTLSHDSARNGSPVVPGKAKTLEERRKQAEEMLRFV